ncbi:MAG TPA: hypothetical protein VHA30_04685 [Patescibacteria group bacterium]|nr:hypothetical protein [Patescibacteria group bacterium]
MKMQTGGWMILFAAACWILGGLSFFLTWILLEHSLTHPEEIKFAFAGLVVSQFLAAAAVSATVSARNKIKRPD